MAQGAVNFQSDPVGLASAISQLVGKDEEQLAWDGEVPVVSSLWRRIGRRGLRLLWGTTRWERRRMANRMGRIMAASAKPVLVYVVPFDIWKLRTGGGQRIAGIAKAASRLFNVVVLTSSWSVQKFACRRLGPECHLLAAPVGAGFMEQMRAEKGAGLFAFIDHFDRLPEFRWMLEAVAGHARAWGIVHPIAWPAIQPYLRSEDPVFYDAHDDYAQFLQHAYGEADDRRVVRLLDMERDVIKRSTAAVFCTPNDLAAVCQRIPVCAARLMVVPNGVDTTACRAVWPGAARNQRQAFGLGRPMAIFMGSIHKPNREAAEFIVRELAPAFPQIIFVIIGLDLFTYRASGHLAAGENMVWTGPVSEASKEALLSMAEIALAPLMSGTGSSLKIPDYVIHGKIVIATPIGLRGHEDLAKFSSIIPTRDVRAALAEVLARLELDPRAYDQACREARDWAKQSLDWSVAAQPLVAALGERVGAGV